jgi:hypothetical protein
MQENILIKDKRVEIIKLLLLLLLLLLPPPLVLICKNSFKTKKKGDSQIVEEIKKKIPKSMKMIIKNLVTQRSESDMY